MLRVITGLFRKNKITDTGLTHHDRDNTLPDKWFTPYDAIELLKTPRRKKLINLIWQRVSMDQTRFDLLYMQAIINYVNIVQQLPASESHHHSYLGGMIDHGLEVVNYALKLRQPYLLPIGGNPEDIPKQTEAWSAAVMYGALLHDIGKVVVDVHVEMNNGQIWYPWHENITRPYRFSYHKKRNYHLHPSAAALMINRIVPNVGITWLSQFPDLFPLFIHLCSGQHEKAGVLAEIIQKADMSSVSNNLGGDPTKALLKPVQSLATKMITSIRYLIESELKLNGQKACDGWFDGSDVWLVSKTFTDKMKANLLQNGITEAPSDNAKIFNILSEHDIAISNSEDKTVWSCKIESESGWVAEKLTLIRIPVNVAYSNVTTAPEPFKGKITPLEVTEKSVDMNQSVEPEKTTLQQDVLVDTHQEENLTNKSIKEEEGVTFNLNDAVLGLFVGDTPEPDLEPVQHVSSAQTTNDESSSDAVLNDDEKNKPVTKSNDEDDVEHSERIVSDKEYDLPFFKWIRSQIVARKLQVNTQTACIHTIENKIFMVTPRIFQKYALFLYGNTDDENWQRLQSEFQALKIHLKFGADNYNIWKCTISGKRKVNAKIKGYLIDNKLLFGIDSALPDNPHLTLIHDIQSYTTKRST